MERRTRTRYNLSAPVSFLWKNRGGSRHRGEGFTRDVCSGGVFVFTDTYPPLNAGLQIEVMFPSLEAGSALQMRAQGQVLRVEPIGEGEKRGGFAAVCKTFVLRNKKVDVAK